MPSNKPFPEIPALVRWQQDFVSKFASQPHSKSLLVAAPGTGKTATALFAANKMLTDGAVDSVLVISDRVMLQDQWRDVASRYGLNLEEALRTQLGGHGVSTTLQALSKGADALIDTAAKARRWLIIGDESMYPMKSLMPVVDRMLRANDGSRALFIASRLPSDFSFEAEFTFNTESILDRRIIQSRATQIQVARYSPSFALLRGLQTRPIDLDSLSWRQFEKLIATLLEGDGYSVELMQGSKDGGVDVVAVKDLGSAGYFKTLWQAKKKNVKNKVGICVVRELADTRQELRASKGIIVTSSYLTRGALERINRDKYILGKVDREDLEQWIKKTLFG